MSVQHEEKHVHTYTKKSFEGSVLSRSANYGQWAESDLLPVFCLVGFSFFNLAFYLTQQFLKQYLDDVLK